MIISSRTNPRVTLAASLNEKKYREESRLFLIEGKKLFCEAVSTGVVLHDIFCLPEYEDFVKDVLPGTDPCVVSSDILCKISREKSPDGIICTGECIDKIHFFNKIYINEDFAPDRRYFMLSGVSDPGNVGTIIRSAAAMGIDEIIMSCDCADIYSPRAVRSSMGALFRIRVSYAASLPDAVTALRSSGRRVLAAVLDENAVSLDRAGSLENTVIVAGNEGHGVAPDVYRACDGGIFIPMKNGVESLNVAAASAIFMWHSAVGGYLNG